MIGSPTSWSSGVSAASVKTMEKVWIVSLMWSLMLEQSPHKRMRRMLTGTARKRNSDLGLKGAAATVKFTSKPQILNP